MQTHDYDLVVLGAGSGGYAAARVANELGAKVALVDHGPLGGLCILRGCMPSKAFIASSDALHDVRESPALGIQIEGTIAADMQAVALRKRALVKEFADHRIEGINTFPVHLGHAQFVSDEAVMVGEDMRLQARSFIIATGSSVAPVRIPGLSEAGYIDSDGVLELERIPGSVAVLGGGYTACELGQFLARMGAKTTVLIRSNHLLTDADDDVGEALTGYFREDGINVVTYATVARVEKRGQRKVVHYAVGGERLELAVEEIFFAMGRVPNVEGLGLAAAGVEYDLEDGIGVDLTLRTNRPNIFAIGDVMDEFQLVHVAIYQGEIAARNAVSGTNEEADYRIFGAHAIFTDPQIAHVGMTEKDLKRAGIEYLFGRYDFAEHGKAMCLNKTRGFVKMMARPKTGEILGASVIGPQGSELIHEVIVAMNYRATVGDFMRIPHLHPTLAEIWTYPAEECAAQCGLKEAVDQMVEMATSGGAD
ncbi:MAG TPA: dihydrolipoyl dehydrogenase [Candidatus Baltobacteraceae bacterium]|nr:dihydrolipoyl dehydrogenase [Candidatus Baltobacteraceae bacterium]